ncbi:MAG: replication-associated recombination protein A [Desulfobacterota bacterium]|nr:replication-associated recombination protein A [Thermodesulfobacteriota bacterium]MDW8002403.1 replication-associated recombination protein A [Deltaproteobacteria bacterium]
MTIVDLFDTGRKEPYTVPLAERMRPQTLKEFVGQTHVLGKGKLLFTLIKQKKVPSMVLWGPSGCGKTTLAYIIAKELGLYAIFLSAVSIGVKEMREIIKRSKNEKILLFLDEFHSLNRSKQDLFLPYVEKGQILLIGATTENPSFAIIKPLLSRMKVVKLNPLSEEELFFILKRAKDNSELNTSGVLVNDEMLSLIASLSDGDARRALTILEMSHSLAKEKNLQSVDSECIFEACQIRPRTYDRKGDMHYGLASAFIKSMRGSDPDAALYWMMRMINAGEDPLYIARRMVIFASEDVGCADPYALTLAISAKEAFEFLGPPEGYLALAQACIYLSLCEKSNSVYVALQKAEKDVSELPEYPVPIHLRTAPTKLMRDLGYGKEYLYPHDFEGGIVKQSYRPEEIAQKRYYFPTTRGYEVKLKEYLEKARNIIYGDPDGDSRERAR